MCFQRPLVSDRPPPTIHALPGPTVAALRRPPRQAALRNLHPARSSIALTYFGTAGVRASILDVASRGHFCALAVIFARGSAQGRFSKQTFLKKIFDIQEERRAVFTIGGRFCVNGWPFQGTPARSPAAWAM
jgi:hypothetical protein